MSKTNNLVGRNLCKAVLALAISTVLPATNAVAQTSEAVSAFDIPAGKLSDALDSFMSQSGAQILYKSDLVAGKKSQALRGSMDKAVALTQLLSGTDLVWEKANGSTFVIKRIRTVPTKPGRPQDKVRSTPVSEARNEATTMDTVVVTGTRIRGGSTASPTITIDAERIRDEGFTDLGEVIRSIPQNYSGGQNPGVTGADGTGNLANTNTTGGSGLNLRGLGPDASLTLLNGRRLSYGGYKQAVDISAIPLEAVDRVEIVADGASAIYGSDAVGGVGNVILKREFEGVTVGARYGAALEGGLDTHEYTVTAGTTWETGGLIATYKNTSADPIFVDQRDYTDGMYNRQTLYPGSDMRSGLLSAHQWLGEHVELRLDTLRTERESLSYNAYQTYYNRFKPETEISLVSPTIEFSLPNDWTLLIGGAKGKDEYLSIGSRITSGTGLSEAYSPFGYNNTSRSYEVSAEGPLLALSSGDMRLAIGAGYRTNGYQNVSGEIYGGEESSRFAYAEINLPLMRNGSDAPGAQRLVLTAAVRGEDYDSFGGVTTPKLGLIYRPSADFTLKASWGRSFKAPTLEERYAPKIAYLFNASDVGGTGYAENATVILPSGGNSDLDAERARTWTASLSFHPEALPGLEAEISWFDIDYADRVVIPIGVLEEALSNPIYAEFVNYSPTQSQLSDIVTTSPLYNFSTNNYDPANVVAIALYQNINAKRQRAKGIDLSGSYRLDLGDDQLTIRGSVSWLDSAQQTTVGQNSFNLSGIVHNPAKLNSRLGGLWNHGAFTASAFANYASGVTNRVNGEKTASFTTFDTTLGYSSRAEGEIWSGLEIALSVQNLLNRAPPLYTPPFANYVPYDSTNYSAIGRFISVSVSKHW